MKPIIINAITLSGIAEAARLWYAKMNETYHTFPVEEKQAKRLRDQLWKTEWDKKARLFIDELPF